MDRERVLKGTASGQYGLITRQQALFNGYPDDEIGRRISAGRLTSLHPGVYYTDSVPPTWRTDVLAAVLAAGPLAVASHRTAAVLYQMDAIWGRMVEMTVPYLKSPEPEGVVLHRTRRENDTPVLEGIPITTPAKTLLDVASTLPYTTLAKATRSALHLGLVTTDALLDTVVKFGGRGVRGTRKYRRVIGWVAADKSGSPAEIDMAEIIADSQVPTPVQQLKLLLPTGDNAYPDFAWPDRNRII